MNCPECGQACGYKCNSCGKARPKTWFVYRALNQQTRETLFPVCGSCAQNPEKFIPAPWKLEGPFKQGDTIPEVEFRAQQPNETK